MARTKRNIIVKRGGLVIMDTTTPTPTPKAKKAKVKRVTPKQWGMTRTEQRLATDMPERKDLTTSQWREWGEGLKTLRLYEVPKAELLSLNDQRELVTTLRYYDMYYGAQTLR